MLKITVTFFTSGLYELFGTSFQPLECRFCHYERNGKGADCHLAIENDWRSAEGRLLVRQWCRGMAIWDFLEVFGLIALKN